jgi:type I restriction enzyme R subunit
MPTEADARIVADQLLRDAGWDIANKAQVSTEEPAADGRADYLLKNSRTQPIAVIEAKRFSIDPYSAKGKAKAYAGSLGAPFVLLSNGNEHFFLGYADGDARPILGLPSQPDLERRVNLKVHRRGSLADSLGAISLPSRFAFPGEKVETRPYQLRCLKRADAALVADGSSLRWLPARAKRSPSPPPNVGEPVPPDRPRALEIASNPLDNMLIHHGRIIVITAPSASTSL